MHPTGMLSCLLHNFEISFQMSFQNVILNVILNGISNKMTSKMFNLERNPQMLTTMTMRNQDHIGSFWHKMPNEPNKTLFCCFTFAEPFRKKLNYK